MFYIPQRLLKATNFAGCCLRSEPLRGAPLVMGLAVRVKVFLFGIFASNAGGYLQPANRNGGPFFRKAG